MSIRRSGDPSRSSSEESAAGSQYWRISSPITVPEPICVSSLPSVAVVIRVLLLAALIRLNPGGADHLAPFLGFLNNMLSKIDGRTNKHCGAETSKLRLQLGIRKARIDLSVEFVDDRAGCSFGRTSAKPATGFIARQEVSYCRKIRQGLRVYRRGQGQRAKLAAFHVFNG